MEGSVANSLRDSLPILMPKAVVWAKEQESLILNNGIPLDSNDTALAKSVGVTYPEQVRILEVGTLPLPDDGELKQAALLSGLFGPNIIGLTFGHGVYLVKGHKTKRLTSHELRHVYQYENAGSIDVFLPQYLEQLISFGYEKAPLEIDARNHQKT